MVSKLQMYGENQQLPQHTVNIRLKHVKPKLGGKEERKRSLYIYAQPMRCFSPLYYTQAPLKKKAFPLSCSGKCCLFVFFFFFNNKWENAVFSFDLQNKYHK